MKSEFNFETVIGRLKKALQIKEDKQMAELLGMSPAAFNGRKKSDSIPFDAVISLSAKENLDYNWLLTGEGTMLKGGGANDENMSPKRKKMMELLERLDDDALDDAIYSTKKLVEGFELRNELAQMRQMISKQQMAAWWKSFKAKQKKPHFKWQNH